jgi:hypothetical protein
VDSRAGLDDVEKRKFLTLPALELRPLCHPARSQSLYRLSYRNLATAAENRSRGCVVDTVLFLKPEYKVSPLPVEASYNTSTAALRVVENDEKKTRWLGV